MFKYKGRLAVLTAAMVSLTGCSPLIYDLRPYDPQTLTTGEWMGVAIGMERDAARRIILDDERFAAGLSRELKPGKAYCGNADFIDNYRMVGLMNTLRVEVYSKNGRVTCLKRLRARHYIS